MAHRVGDFLKQDPLKIRFTSSNPQNSQPKSIIKRALNQSVADITATNYYSSHPNVIVYYELLDISIVELETKKSLKVVWTGRNNKEEVSSRATVIRLSAYSRLCRARIRSCCPRIARSAMLPSKWQRRSRSNRVVVERSGFSTFNPMAERRRSSPDPSLLANCPTPPSSLQK